MKTLKISFIILFFLQLKIFAQNVSHPTIDTLDVTYMSAPNNQVIPEVIIHLKTWVGVSKVYCKIIDPINNTTVYNISYIINDMPVSNSNGVVLCLKDNMVVQILGTISLPLKRYTYQIQTEDSQGNISTNYGLTKELES